MRLPEAGRSRLAVAATLLALAPTVVAIARLVGHDGVLLPDTSLIDLLTRDVFSSDSPLVGPYSRYGWNHPGPLLFYALAPLNALFDGATWSTLVGGAVLQGIAIAWAARLAWKRDGLGLVLLVLAAMTGVYVAADASILLDAWNPTLPLPYFMVFVLQVWSVIVGDRWRLVGAVVVGTFLVHAHASFASVVVAGFACIIGIAIIDGRHDRATWSAWSRPLLVAAGVGFLVWLPPLIDQVGDQGNLSDVFDYATSGHDNVAGLSRALGIVAATFRLPPPWLAGDEIGDPITAVTRTASIAWLAIPLALLAIGLFAAHRSRSRDGRRLLVLLAVVTIAGTAALARLERPYSGYLFSWRLVVATMLLAAVAWVAARAVGMTAAAAPGRAAAAAFLALIAAGSGVLASQAATRPRAEALLSSTTQSFIRRLGAIDVRGPVMLRDVSSGVTGLFDGLFDGLEREGVPVRIDESVSFAYGRNRGARLDHVRSVWLVTDSGVLISELSALARAKVLVLDSSLPPAEERELTRLQRSLRAFLRDAGRNDLAPALDSPDAFFALGGVPGIDPDALDRLLELNKRIRRQRGHRAAVIALPPDHPRAAGRAIPEPLR